MKKIKLSISKEILEQKYIIEKKSSRLIAKELGWGRSTILNRWREFNISVRENTALRKGMKFGKKWCSNISANHADVTGTNNPMYDIHRFGFNSPGWKGGTTKIILSVRSLNKYTYWRLSVFERDLYRCIICGDNKGGNLQADHIIPLSYLISKFKIKTTEEAYNFEKLWDINNGRTLCKSCHKKTNTWGYKASKYGNIK